MRSNRPASQLGKQHRHTAPEHRVNMTGIAGLWFTSASFLPLIRLLLGERMFFSSSIKLGPINLLV